MDQVKKKTIEAGGWLKKNLQKINLPTWLEILLIVIFLLRIPSFLEPYSYGDEMIYLSLGNAVRKGMVLYRDIHDNKPPLLYLMAAFAGNLFWFKAFLAIWMLITTVLFWKLVQTLFEKNQRIQKISTIAFALLTTLPLLEGNIVNAELFMIGPIIAAFLILLKEKQKLWQVFLAGVLFSIAALFKIPAAFDLPVIVFFWLIVSHLKGKELVEIIKKAFVLAIGFLLPLGLTLIWYYFRGALPQYLVAAFGQNLGYLSSFRPGDVQKSFLVRNGPLLIRAGIVGLGLLITFLARKKLSKPFILASIWILFSLFAVTLSERPYPHYLIQAVPAVSILIGILFGDKSIEQSLVIIPLALTAFVPVYYKFWYYQTANYYLRFFKLATDQISKEEYLNSFGDQTQVNYQIAERIRKSTKPNEKIFVWGNSSVVYTLSQRQPPIRYVADYHIKDFSSQEETIRALEKDKPVYIIILPNAPIFPELNSLLEKDYAFVQTIDTAQIYHLINSKH